MTIETIVRVPRPGGSEFVANVLLSWLARPWLVMLALGAVHHDVWDRVPALGFWQTWISLALIGLLRGGKTLSFPTSMWTPRSKT